MFTRRPVLPVALVVLIALSTPLAAVTVGATTPAGRDGPSAPRAEAGDCAPLVVGDSRPAPENDTLGWERGCWADQRLALDRSDGLNATERGAVVSRTMARIERIRRLEFVERVTVAVRNGSFGGRVTDDYDRMQTAKYRALLLLGEDERYADAVGETNPPGYTVNGIRVVRMSAEASPDFPAWFLAHELTHALQHQHFDELPRGDSTDEQYALSAVTEGGAQYVQHRYERRCADGWQCGETERENFSDLHPGLFALSSFPYMEGMAFVHAVQQRDGWAGVDALYENPPRSSSQVIHPETYPAADAGPTVRVADRSSADWRVVSTLNGDADRVGEAGAFVLFAYPSWDDETDEALFDRKPFVDRYDEPPVSFDPYDYAHRWSSGLADDRVIYYRNDEFPGDSASVWKLRWETDRDAREFLEGYRALLELRGASAVDDAEGVWRIPDDRRFGDAFSLARSGDTVVVVNAPTVDALDEIRAPADASSTPESSPGDVARDPPATTSDDAPNGTGGETTAASSPGFSGLAAVAAIVAVALGTAALGRRRRD